LQGTGDDESEEEGEEDEEEEVEEDEEDEIEAAFENQAMGTSCSASDISFVPDNTHISRFGFSYNHAFTKSLTRLNQILVSVLCFKIHTMVTLLLSNAERSCAKVALCMF